jgi:hypothetical protein
MDPQKIFPVIKMFQWCDWSEWYQVYEQIFSKCDPSKLQDSLDIDLTDLNRLNPFIDLKILTLNL